MNMTTGSKMQSVMLLFKRLFDLPASTIESARPHQLRSWLKRIQFELERERNRGTAKHYRYDFNRHLALARMRNILQERLNQSN